MSEKRVVITGVGVKTPVGLTLDTYWNNLLEGKSGVGQIEQFDTTGFSVTIAGEIKDFNPLDYFENAKEARKADRYAQFAVGAATDAYQDSGLGEGDFDPKRASVLVGSGIGGLSTLENQCKNLLEKGPSRISPFTIPMMISNIASGMISIKYGFKGPNFAIVTACATATQSIGAGYQLIKSGQIDVAIAGGSEAAVRPLGVGGFASMKAISTRNDEPEKASRPFDKDRDGFVLGEGAGVLVLEDYDSAKKRGAHIYGELVGYGESADAYHITSPPPGGVGAAQAMETALENGGIAREDIDYINAHGTSTPQGDVCESKAIRSVFGDHADNVWVSSTKSMIGHLLGAAGGVEMAACLKTLETGKVHPTINLDNPDPECDLDYVSEGAREGDIQMVMSNSFGFGGHNACLIARKVV